MIKVTKRDGESTDKLIKRFASHVKSRRLMQWFRNHRYFQQKPTKKSVRQSAVKREEHRKNNKRKQFLGT